ncbi:MAG: glutamate 5-kinase [Actinobacteria bacterium]|nr:glutamate 5-kinase [Actinomycetota bacterium]
MANARRIVVKVGSSSLTGVAGGIDPVRIGRIVDAIAAARKAGREVVLVSSGAIAAGMGPLGMRTRPRDLASQQAAASVGQGLLVEQYSTLFAVQGLTVGQVLLTVDDTTRQGTYRNALRTFDRLLELGIVPVVNENDTVATQEIRFGDNDRLAALVAHLVRADALFLLSDVDALYTAHPSSPGAQRITDVPNFDELVADTSRLGSAVGTGGMATKLEAARIAVGAGIPVVLAGAEQVADALAGRCGTVFHPAAKRRSSRLNWLAHASQPTGELELDEGAVKAITKGKASLLPAGITAVRGSFQAGEPVLLVDPDGAPIARGIVNYDSDVLPALLGRSTKDLARELGVEYEREVIHRDSLVVRRPRRTEPTRDTQSREAPQLG